MKQLVIEEIAKTICNEIKLRSVTRLEVVNDAEAFDRCDNTVCTWLDFEELWKTDNSYVYSLDRLWNRPMLQNLVFFYMENRHDICMELAEYLSEEYSDNVVRVGSTARSMIIEILE